MDQRKIILVLAGLLVLAVGAFGWSLTRGYEKKKDEVQSAALPGAQKNPDQAACGSNATYGRLKEVAFEEAVRLRNADPANLDTLAENSVVRMENPVVMSRDEDLNVTVCSGRFILELPPGAEAAFGGQRRLTANIEYSAQSAADGSGLVYQIRGAEPIIQKLAAFNLRGAPSQLPSAAQQPTEYVEAAPPPPPAASAPPAAPAPATAPPPAPAAPRTAPSVAPRPAPPPAPAPAPKVERREPVRTAARSNPSFNCRFARSSSERQVCSRDRLAAKDRAMSSLFYSALSDADSSRRRELRRTRDRFLAYRDRCGTEACIAEAYDGRMNEIRDIMAGD
ncbi:MAG TPA: hypothetical protein VF662_02500 [Allosphingosinicella sp.]|jgi:hypothetical protein